MQQDRNPSSSAVDQPQTQMVQQDQSHTQMAYPMYVVPLGQPGTQMMQYGQFPAQMLYPGQFPTYMVQQGQSQTHMVQQGQSSTQMVQQGQSGTQMVQQGQFPVQMGQPGFVVVGQPPPGQPGQQMGWMVPPPPVPGCPPGMECLSVLDQILIKQAIHALEVLTVFEVRNKFRLYNSIGQQCYFAFEESDFFQRQFCCANRWFVYHITDNMQQDVFRVRHEFQCCHGACDADRGYVFATNVEDRSGTLLGQVTDKRSGTEIGSITRLRTGILQEVLTDSDNFLVT
ncbi:hypothetical protein BaRGS_00023331, partial [Batillaria attramentaria]